MINSIYIAIVGLLAVIAGGFVYSNHNIKPSDLAPLAQATTSVIASQKSAIPSRNQVANVRVPAPRGAVMIQTNPVMIPASAMTDRNGSSNLSQPINVRNKRVVWRITSIAPGSISFDNDNANYTITIGPKTVFYDSARNPISFSKIKVGDNMTFALVAAPNPLALWVIDMSI